MLSSTWARVWDLLQRWMKCVIDTFSVHEHRTRSSLTWKVSEWNWSLGGGTVALCYLYTYCTVFRFHKVETDFAGAVDTKNKEFIWVFLCEEFTFFHVAATISVPWLGMHHAAQSSEWRLTGIQSHLCLMKVGVGRRRLLVSQTDSGRWTSFKKDLAELNQEVPSN